MRKWFAKIICRGRRSMTSSPPHVRARAEFDLVLNAMVGRSIAAVTYYELVYDSEESAMWNRESDSFDSLDFGLTLRLDDGSSVSVTWGDEFFHFNVSVQRGELTFAGTVRRWDVTSRWAEYLHLPIAEVTAAWRPGGGYLEPSPEYPESVVLRFRSGASIVLLALESRDGGNFHTADHITVFFDESEARRLGLL